MESDPRFKNVTRTRGSKPKKEHSNKNKFNNVTTTRRCSAKRQRGHTSSFKHSPAKIEHKEPIFQAIAFDNAINRGDTQLAYKIALKMNGYHPADLLLKARCKPQEKIDPLVGKNVLPAQINEEKFKSTGQRLSERRTQRLLNRK